MAWNPIQTQLGRASSSLMANAMEASKEPGRIAGDYLARVAGEDERAYQRGRQKVADDRATTVWDQQQLARKGGVEAGLMAGKENEALLARIAEESKMNPRGQVLASGQLLQQQALPQVQIGGVQTPIFRNTSTKEVIPGHYGDSNPEVTYANKGLNPSASESIGTDVRDYVLKDKRYSTNEVVSSARKPNALGENLIAQLQPKQDAINAQYDKMDDMIQPGEFGIRGRTFDTLAHKALDKDRERALSEGLRVKSPGTSILSVKETSLNNIDNSVPYNAQGKIFSQADGKANKEVYLKDKSGDLVNMKEYDKASHVKANSYVPAKTVTQNGIEIVQPANYGTKQDGTPITNSLHAGSSLITTPGAKGQATIPYGVNGESTLKVSKSNIVDRVYESLESTIPKDHKVDVQSAKARIMIRMAEMGIPPSDVDVDKIVATAMGDGSASDRDKAKYEIAKSKAVSTIAQYNNDRTYGLQVSKFNEDMRSNKVREGLSLAQLRQQAQQHKDTLKVARNPVQEAIDKEMAMRELDRKFPKKLNPSDALDYTIKKKKLERDDETYGKQHDWIPFND